MNVKKYFRVHRHDVLCASFITFQKIPKLYMWGCPARQPMSSQLTAPFLAEILDLVKDFINSFDTQACDHIICDLCCIAQLLAVKNSNLKLANTFTTNDTCTIPIWERILCLILSIIRILFYNKRIQSYIITHSLSPYYQPFHNTHHKGHAHHQHPSAHIWT